MQTGEVVSCLITNDLVDTINKYIIDCEKYRWLLNLNRTRRNVDVESSDRCAVYSIANW